jgi:hypothetical protein
MQSGISVEIALCSVGGPSYNVGMSISIFFWRKRHQNRKAQPLLVLLALAAAICLPSVPSSAATLYVYSRLQLKDLDEMNKLVQGKIRDARKSGDKIPPLRDAMQAVYSRPNEDFMIEKIVGPLRTELEDADAWENTLRSLVDEAVKALSEPKGFKPEAQVTYAIFLENILAELKPDANRPFEKSIITQIRDAKIELTKQEIQERTLRVMRKVKSPSEIAEQILKEFEKAEKEKAKSENKKKSDD